MSEKLGGLGMNEIIVFHGGTDIIEKPVSGFGRKNLDFGQGFYVTNIREQAMKWAENMARNRKLSPVINRYYINRDAIMQEFRCKVFEAYDEDWLRFIIVNRTGENDILSYDYVEGGVANDRVIDTINLYIAGLMELPAALRELAKHQPNNQMCILNQEIINKYLRYDGTDEI